MTDEASKAAHDLRNLLGLVALEVHSARAAVADAEATRRSLDQISDLVLRCSHVIVALEAQATAATPLKRAGKVA